MTAAEFADGAGAAVELVVAVLDALDVVAVAVLDTELVDVGLGDGLSSSASR